MKHPKIISISRRTDIPAYYADWLIRRINIGYTVYPNPVSGKPVFLSLKPEEVKILVFWTRNPLPLFPHLDFIDKYYKHYMHLTINGLPKILEWRNPAVDTIIEAARKLSKRYGKHYVQWRFDPVILSTVTPEDFILRRFEYIASQLNGYIENCYISFVDFYKKTEENFQRLSRQHRIKFTIPSKEQEISIAQKLAQIAQRYHMTVNACAEEHLAGIPYIKIAQCINIDLINKITGVPLKNFTLQNSRAGCHCINAPDIGYYDSCPHGCIYCYSNKTPEIALKNARLYRKIGFPMDDLEMPEKKDKQLSLF
jgi:DNA repair photolyase